MLLLLLPSLALLAAAVSPALVLNGLPPSEARRRAAVPGLPHAAPSYSGFFRIRPDAYTFFWFFEALEGGASAPLSTWLQGGPGGASEFGLFSENGPFSVSENGTLVPRHYSWSNKISMLFIDNPVGCGFSFTNDPNGFVTNEKEVGEDLFTFITLFFQAFPEYQESDFFVAGESYGGKYGPAFAAEIVAQKAAGNSSINLAGLSVGDGALEPRIQFTDISSLAYFISFADENEFQVMKTYEKKIADYIDMGEYVKAFRVFDEYLNGDFYHYGTYFHNVTGLTDYFNLLQPTYPPNPYPALLNTPEFKERIHTGSIRYFDYNASVEEALIGDWMVGVQPQLISVLNAGVRVLIYNGQLDVILGSPLCLDVLRQLKWNGLNQWNDAPKQIWKIPGGEVGGYVKASGALTHVAVRKAGHLVPADQPAFAYDMINRFVFNEGWN